MRKPKTSYGPFKDRQELIKAALMDAMRHLNYFDIRQRPRFNAYKKQLQRMSR